RQRLSWQRANTCLFFSEPAPSALCTLSLHDALPIFVDGGLARIGVRESVPDVARVLGRQVAAIVWRTYEQSRIEEMAEHAGVPVDRKSTRLNSSHVKISYAVFCLKKKKSTKDQHNVA